MLLRLRGTGRELDSLFLCLSLCRKYTPRHYILYELVGIPTGRAQPNMKEEWKQKRSEFAALVLPALVVRVLHKGDCPPRFMLRAVQVVERHQAVQLSKADREDRNEEIG